MWVRDTGTVEHKTPDVGRRRDTLLGRVLQDADPGTGEERGGNERVVAPRGRPSDYTHERAAISSQLQEATLANTRCTQQRLRSSAGAPLDDSLLGSGFARGIGFYTVEDPRAPPSSTLVGRTRTVVGDESWMVRLRHNADAPLLYDYAIAGHSSEPAGSRLPRRGRHVLPLAYAEERTPGSTAHSTICRRIGGGSVQSGALRDAAGPGRCKSPYRAAATIRFAGRANIPSN